MRRASPKRPRHFILFRYDGDRIAVLRVLHDAMDLAHHVDEREGDA